MILIKKAGDLAHYLRAKKNEGLRIGFVPTMGALHQGHLSLIDASRQQTGLTVCSIFVNPTQFNDPGDFQKYPSTIEQDIFVLERNQTDVLFLPSVEEVYRKGTQNLEHYDLGSLDTVLEGKYRPGHFQGVCQVMSRLIGLVGPDDLFMGQKDYQQCLVIKRLLSIMDEAACFHVCPTTREAGGLAMSSRNLRLSESQKKGATAIFHALAYLRAHLADHCLEDLISHAKKMLLENNFRVDYVAVADAATLEAVDADTDKPLVALIAAFLQEIRLIDNMLLNETAPG
jgi:pantoate--beta-alanine ligase